MLTGPASGEGTVSTLAGSSYGFADDTGTRAKFSRFLGIASDAAGNLYIADQDNHRIRKITPAGVTSTLAGSGQSGYLDSTGTVAKFSYPQGITLDAAGNMYVSDVNNHRIRKITPAGRVSTFAGSGIAGSVNGMGTAAQFDIPSGMATDAAGNIYVTDENSCLIRKITPAGLVSTLAGSGRGYADGAAAAAKFDSPTGITVDAAGNVYVADWQNNCIRKITPSGQVSTVAGGSQGFADGAGTAARFSHPYGLVLDAAGYLIVTDAGNNRLRRVSPAGIVNTAAGDSVSGTADGIGPAARFNYPSGITQTTAGAVFIADENNTRIRKVTLLPTIDGYIWSGGGRSRADTIKVSGNYTLRIFSGGCTSAVSQTIPVLIHPDSPVISASGLLNMCFGDSITLTSSVPAGNRWSTGDTTARITVRAAGTYSLFTVADVCTSAARAQVTVTVRARPAAPSITFAGGLLSATAGGTTYNWYLNGQLLPGFTSRTLPSQGPGFYTVRLKLSSGCFTPQSGAYEIVGLPGLLANNIQVSPNPFSSILRISGLTGTCSVKVFSAAGQLVYSALLADGAGDIDLERQPAGLYSLLLNGVVYKVVKE